LNLLQCIKLWGFSPFGESVPISKNLNNIKVIENFGRETYKIPIIPYAYFDWLIERSNILREVIVLNRISGHPNVIKFYKLLEKITVWSGMI